MTIGERIRLSRERANMTQEELGKKIGTTKQTIFKYETGVITNIPLDRLERLAGALGVTSAYLIGWAPQEAPVESVKTVDDDDIKFALFGGDGEITDEMYDEVKRFAAYIKSRESK